MSDFEIDHGDQKAPKSWESDFARQKRQREWALRDAQVSVRKPRWLPWLFLGLCCACGATYSTWSICTKTAEMQPILDAPLARPLNARAPVNVSPTRATASDFHAINDMAPPTPIAAPEPAPEVAQPQAAAQAPVINQRALERCQSHIERLQAGIALLAKDRQERYAYWDSRDRYTYGTPLGPDRQTRQRDGLMERLNEAIVQFNAMNPNPGTNDGVLIYRDARTQLQQLQTEFNNCVKDCEHTISQIQDLQRRESKAQGDLVKAQSELADIQAGNGPPPDPEPATQDDHPHGIIQLAK